jgi:TonB-dependent SusC/RagA subfamily outer membrane receptor
MGNPFQDIIATEVVSIKVLNDAGATSIYGSRGANVAILTTTKLGSTGKITAESKSTLEAELKVSKNVFSEYPTIF